MFALVAPTVAGVTDSDGNPIEVAEKIDGGPSVLFDAVAVVVSADEAAHIAALPGARDFVSDAHAHKKLVVYLDASAEVFAAAGIDVDGAGYQRLDGTRKSADAFVQACRSVRAWDRDIG